jgi:ATP-dependent DNA helicase RecQ
MTDSTNLEKAREILRVQFGLEEFREGQEEVIQAVLSGRNCIVVMPTGGGKSLCYQLPALMLAGKTLVVSPLIALMKDQAESLIKKNLPATFINSSLSFDEQQTRLRSFILGHAKILLIAPERFRSASFTDVLREQEISLFAVDEAHCISHWGHDFRPEYLKLRQVIESLGNPQVIALTATATPLVRSDIIEQLNLTDPAVFVAGFDRENLRLQVTHTPRKAEKLDLLERLIKKTPGVGIVYSATRKMVGEISYELQARGLRVAAYHAGMPTAEREAAQNRFMSGELRAIVATNAFGMGIDKPDLRFVIHYNITGAVEDYYQEIGRAGRDGQSSECILLFSPSDINIQEFFLEGDNPHPELIAKVYSRLLASAQKPIELTTEQLQAATGARNPMAVGTALTLLERAGHIRLQRSFGAEKNFYRVFPLDNEPVERLRIDQTELARRTAFNMWKLEQMVEYAHTSDCLRGFVLKYFGDKKQLDHCGSCSNCLARGYKPAQTQRFSKPEPKDKRQESELEEFIVKTAPTGRELRQTLKARSEKLRQLERLERPTTPSEPEPPAQPPAILQWEPAQVALQCVAALDARFGKTTIAALLAGSQRRVIVQNRLDQTSFHGKLAFLGRQEISTLLDQLIEHGYLEIRGQGGYPLLGLTERGREAVNELRKS